MNRPRNPSCRSRFQRLAACLLFALALLFRAGPLPAEESATISRVQADVAFLADDGMQGRGVGTVGLERAAEFIAKRFGELGLKTDLAGGRPFQVFSSSTRVPKVEQGVNWEAIHAAKGEKLGTASPAETPPPDMEADDSADEAAEKSRRSGRRAVEVKNVVALLPGEGPTADEIIVVGAHYDHLGYREKNGEVTVFNGANDNASGTAAMLEIARILCERKQKLPRSVLFIAFAAEERGLLGSFYYVKHPLVPLEKTIAMINLDMVGCIEDDRITAGGVGTAPALGDLVEQVAGQHELDVIRMPGSIGGSDHMAFYTHEIPVVHLITTGGWKDYHKPTDDVETVDSDGIARISQMAAGLVVELAESDEPPEFKDSGWGGAIARNLFRLMGSAASAMVEPKKNDQQN